MMTQSLRRVAAGGGQAFSAGLEGAARVRGWAF
jgi:hypothetical protein